MKRREFIKGSLAVGAAAVLPKFASKKERAIMGMPFIQKYRIHLADKNKENVEFSREEIDPGGTVSFYMLEGEGPNEWLVKRYSPHHYVKMVNVTAL